MLSTAVRVLCNSCSKSLNVQTLVDRLQGKQVSPYAPAFVSFSIFSLTPKTFAETPFESALQANARQWASSRSAVRRILLRDNTSCRSHFPCNIRICWVTNNSKETTFRVLAIRPLVLVLLRVLAKCSVDCRECRSRLFIQRIMPL